MTLQYEIIITNTFLDVKFLRNLIIVAITEIDDPKSWETDVLSSDKPVFVDFWAQWCGPCRMVGPVVEELAGDYDGKVNFVKVNVDNAQEIAQKYNVFSIPTLLLLNKGEIIAQQVGAGSKEVYQNMIDRALEKI
jgi:thioredoxin 1|tara:strand:+ start:107 stop:511 length:405 start_codon:yes stop_codon:yes gene_type:complete